MKVISNQRRPSLLDKILIFLDILYFSFVVMIKVLLISTTENVSVLSKEPTPHPPLKCQPQWEVQLHLSPSPHTCKVTVIYQSLQQAVRGHTAAVTPPIGVICMCGDVSLCSSSCQSMCQPISTPPRLIAP